MLIQREETMKKVWTKEEQTRLWNTIEKGSRPRNSTLAMIFRCTEDEIADEVFRLRLAHRHDWITDIKVAFFDIEATNLKANIGHMISYAIKPEGKPVKFNCWTRKEAIDRNKLDKRLMKDLITDLQNVDLLVTYYGTGFDNKFIRTRAMMLGLENFPEFGQLKHYDVYYGVRNNMQLYSNRLAVATQALGINGKTPLPASLWTDARLGYPDAMKEIKEHNIADVQILEDLYQKIVPHVKVTRKSI